MQDQRHDFSLHTCPFCGKKAFVRSRMLNTYTCFLCSKTGNFGEQQAGTGMVVDSEQVGDVFYEINEEAASYYYASLQGENAGSAYLGKRQITRSEIDEFGLGYAPSGYRTLFNHLKDKFDLEDLKKSGLFREGKKGGLYDFFRNRVIFPIFDGKQRVVGFGGRVLDDSKPKYLNSSENGAFSKRKMLYGFPYDEKPLTDTIFICEGYMDLIAAKKAGIRDSAAVLGTALTPEHVELIARRYKRVCLGFDSDEAGINAVKKSFAQLHSYGLTVTVPTFKPAKDPDEFLQKFGKEELKERLKNAEPAEQFIARYGDAKELLEILIDHVI